MYCSIERIGHEVQNPKQKARVDVLAISFHEDVKSGLKAIHRKDILLGVGPWSPERSAGSTL